MNFRKSPAADALIRIGVMTIVMVSAIFFVRNFLGMTEPTRLVCEKFDTGMIGTAERIRGNQLSIKMKDSAGSISDIMGFSGPFTCSNIFGKGWIDGPRNSH